MIAPFSFYLVESLLFVPSRPLLSPRPSPSPSFLPSSPFSTTDLPECFEFHSTQARHVFNTSNLLSLGLIPFS